MKTLTNHQAGARGINLKNGSTLWVEPGQTVKVNPDDIIGDLPDFGRKVDPDADAAASDQIAALTAENADLKKQVAALSADLEKATKPAK